MVGIASILSPVKFSFKTFEITIRNLYQGFIQVFLLAGRGEESYGCVCPEMFRLINIMLKLPVGTATVERSFSQMKIIETRLRHHLNDSNLKKKKCVLQLKDQTVNFDEILNAFKEKKDE